MILEQLRKAYRTHPFRPFTICLTDGRKVPVLHPEYLSVSPGATRTFIVWGQGEDYDVVDLLLVKSLQFKTAHSQNGRKR